MSSKFIYNALIPIIVNLILAICFLISHYFFTKEMEKYNKLRENLNDSENGPHIPSPHTSDGRNSLIVFIYRIISFCWLKYL